MIPARGELLSKAKTVDTRVDFVPVSDYRRAADHLQVCHQTDIRLLRGGLAGAHSPCDKVTELQLG